MNIDKVVDYANLFAEIVNNCIKLSSFHNEIYLIKSDVDFILRIAEQSHRDRFQTESEIEFLLYLKENGASISAPISGLDGKYVYDIADDNNTYTISAFEIASGKDFMNRGLDGEERFFKIGKEIGKIHSLSKEVSYKNIKRRKWYESQHLVKASQVFEVYNKNLLSKYHDYIEFMMTLPCDKGSYGLIHGDYLFSNYFFDENDEITIFDFDECEYSWFLYDIAVCLYYSLLGADPKELSEKEVEAANEFRWIIRGYLTENTIEVKQIMNMNLFFKMRDFVLLSTILGNFEKELDGWKKDFVDGALNRILNDKPFMDINFSEIFKTYTK